ncbi:hypothetical protein NQ318_009367 [Aromia moschata]|uniref:Calponin-homology (CH) domain-containing protein n=1 Tax=Aromia moschata TaxID=1265417 RepID=A0AAV8XF37_9CUCU|nr:hypothetical protein NQ318_009367 [Aromia moschata]
MPGHHRREAINKENSPCTPKLENLTLALSSASAIGCNVINIDAHNLSKGTPTWCSASSGRSSGSGSSTRSRWSTAPASPRCSPKMRRSTTSWKLSPEAILLRWVNYHLERAGTHRRVNNFQSDIVDSKSTHLIKQIAPSDADVNIEALYEKDLHNRAEIMLQQAAKLKCRAFDVVNGVYKLNLAFVANLFNNHRVWSRRNGAIDGYETIEETREERTPRELELYSDLADGLVVFQLYDIIKPGTVKWNRVHRKFTNETEKVHGKIGKLQLRRGAR